ncbi:branched-chain amino acid aminotransferase [Kordiimonas pumila]|uniref:Branched-chain-amino-acid aminotransferase n=1 Tax=Kordiimonas pumila TaxID=2161677 RepID=A0ABV7D7F4_9PROT|nr:branched-chain amino acid aminotransferase [Kordiimonas pumila]
MTTAHIRPEILAAIKNTIVPEDKTFGRALFPVIAAATYRNGTWSDLEIKLDTEHAVSAGSVVVQYGQSIFEGMKAYRVTQDIPQIFRPYDHAKRFQRSADRLCMPHVPEELFVSAVKKIADLYTDLIPREHNSALYVRPALFGDDYSLEITPSAGYSFTVHVAPTVPFSVNMKSVLIERENTRAAVGGTGGVKAAGNYAASFLSVQRARSVGCATSIWLDPIEHRYVEELSLMNFFIVKDEKLYTPELTKSFLPGLTRQSILQMANHLGIETVEQPIDINELVADLKKGREIEAFSSGTAAVISPIKSFKEIDGQEFVVGTEPGPVTSKLRAALVDIQEGRAEDLFGWMQNVK